MKTLKKFTVREEVDSHAGLGWFANFEDVGQELRIYGYENIGVPCLFSFKTEFGECTSNINPLSACKRGFFKVMIPHGAKTEELLCADKRIVATLMKAYLDSKAGKHNGCGVFYIVNEREADGIYAQTKIPVFHVQGNGVPIRRH